MTPFALTDIVNSATPLETKFDGIHPRLYLTGDEIEALRAKVGDEPWKSYLNRVIAFADAGTKRGFAASDFKGDLVGFGCTLTNLVVAFRLTREARFLESARALIAGMIGIRNWTTDLQFGHWAHGMALAYDWLFDELDGPTRDLIREALTLHTERTFEYWMTYRSASPVCYAWNHTAIPHSGFIFAGCALWGEVEGPGRWLRMGVEKLRLLMQALGPDGCSAEGLAYGQYHLDFLLRTLLISEQLLGEQFILDSQFLRNYPAYMIHSMLPRHSWRTNPDGPGLPAVAFVQLGDSTYRYHWHGPDYDLRVVARAFRDPYAMWLANQTAEANVCGDTSCFLNLICHDPSITPTPPDALPTFHHLGDKDIVLMRSGWDADAAVAAIKCGPNSGYHARRYRHNISGGHMHPDAGHLVIHAFGEWLLREDGYKRKLTSYHNTILVNGVGQTGEGGLWFEDLEMRKGKPEGRIATAQHHEAYDLITADAADAYEPSAGLKRFLRHVVYLRPHLWIVVDELETHADSTFEQRFHGAAPFTQGADASSWSVRGDRGELNLISLGPTPLSAKGSRYVQKGHGGHIPDEEVDLLSLTNTQPARSALFITVLYAQALSKPPATAELKPLGDRWQVHVKTPGARFQLTIKPGQANAETSILEEVESST